MQSQSLSLKGNVDNQQVKRSDSVWTHGCSNSIDECVYGIYPSIYVNYVPRFDPIGSFHACMHQNMQDVIKYVHTVRSDVCLQKTLYG